MTTIQEREAPEITTIHVYTQSGVLEFNVISTGVNFQEKLAAALEEGTVILDLEDGGIVLLSAVNVVAIEIKNNSGSL